MGVFYEKKPIGCFYCCDCGATAFGWNLCFAMFDITAIMLYYSK